MADTACFRERLFALRDEKNAAFVSKLIPTIPAERILGARTPALRKLAGELYREGVRPADLGPLPHYYLEEYALHAFFIEKERDFQTCIRETERFLPYVDNWATCDSMNPPVFRRNRAALLPHIRRWLQSERPYTQRYGVKMLMDHYLGEDFDPAYPDWVAELQSEEYYVNMMRAWYFATALCKRPEAVLPFLREGRLDRWTHNKAIQKAVESFRVSEELKAQLRGLRRK